MPFSPTRRRFLLVQLLRIAADMLPQLVTGDPIQARNTFLAQVYESDLADSDEELFLLGAIAECVFHAVTSLSDEPKEWLARITE